jgi:hypothetical protein
MWARVFLKREGGVCRSADGEGEIKEEKTLSLQLLSRG